MKVIENLYNIFEDAASHKIIKELTIGLGYTAVVLDDGSTGLAYTWLESKNSCSLIKDPEEYEGKPALGLLKKLHSSNLLERSVAVAAVNALNYQNCRNISRDKGTLLDDLSISPGTRVSMIGYFAPVVQTIEKRGGILTIHDIGKGVGSKEEFYQILEDKTDAVILTSTSLIHGSTEDVLSHVQRGLPCVMLGPSTPMVPKAFAHLPVTILGGMQPEKSIQVLKAIRHGKGTREIQKSSRKLYWKKV